MLQQAAWWWWLSWACILGVRAFARRAREGEPWARAASTRAATPLRQHAGRAAAAPAHPATPSCSAPAMRHQAAPARCDARSRSPRGAAPAARAACVRCVPAHRLTPLCPLTPGCRAARGPASRSWGWAAAGWIISRPWPRSPGLMRSCGPRSWRCGHAPIGTGAVGGGRGQWSAAESACRRGARRPQALACSGPHHPPAAALPLRAQVQGGGNAANALTAAARLGLKPTLVTKVSASSACRVAQPLVARTGAGGRARLPRAHNTCPCFLPCSRSAVTGWATRLSGGQGRQAACAWTAGARAL